MKAVELITRYPLFSFENKNNQMGYRLEIFGIIIFVALYKLFLQIQMCMILELTHNPYSAGIDFSRQNLASVDVRF